MVAKTEEKIYIAIVVFSILMCCTLISSMIKQQANISASKPKEYKLNEVNVVEEKNKEIVLTEEYIASAIGNYLPDGFPKSGISVDIKADGSVYTGVITTRNQLESLVGQSLGFKEKMMLKLLPQQFEMGLYLLASVDDENALLKFQSRGININGMNLPGEMIPAEAVANIADGVNKVLLESGFYFTSLEIGDGQLKLIA